VTKTNLQVLASKVEIIIIITDENLSLTTSRFLSVFTKNATRFLSGFTDAEKNADYRMLQKLATL